MSKINVYSRCVTTKINQVFEYRTSFFLKLFLTGGTFFAIQFLLWKTIFSCSKVSEINGYTLEKMILYFLFSGFIFVFVDSNRIGIVIGNGIRLGELSKFLVYPLSYLEYNFFTFLGGKIIQLLTSLITFAIVWLAFPQVFLDFQVSHFQLLLFVILVFLSLCTNFLLDVLLSNFSFWLDEIWIVIVMKTFMLNLLSGFIVPLDFFPEKVFEIFSYFPFKYVLYFPIQILLGKIETEQIFFGIGILLVWIVIIFFLHKLLWQKGNKLYTGVGM
ncbi:ABC-2 family transporter protein [bacterium]|nr:ABC-2 family transporter protein [bacterium]